MLKLRDVNVRYGAVEAVRGIDIDVGADEVVALVGANGAGKSSLLRAISGLVRETTGTIEFDGRPVLGRPAERIARDGLVHVPEGRHVFPRLSVRENLQVAAWGRRGGVAEDLERVEELFPRLAERRAQAAYTLSGGEQQMLAIGRAVMRQPRLLMLDEPSLGLAPLVVEEVFEMVRRVHATGVPVLLVEQNARLALDVSDRAYVIATGRIDQQGASAELVDSPSVRDAYLGGIGA